MKHLKTFEQLNESLVGDKIKSLLDRFSKGDSKKLAEALMPYKHLLKPYYKKYYINGVVQPELIEADIKRFNFTAKTNEGWFDTDYADEKSNPLILRVLYKIFVRFPKALVEIIVDHFRNTIESFRDDE